MPSSFVSFENKHTVTENSILFQKSTVWPRHTDCGEAGSAASRKQGDRVGRSCTMTSEKNSKNDILF